MMGIQIPDTSVKNPLAGDSPYAALCAGGGSHLPPPPFLGDPAMTPVSPAVLFLPGDTAVCHSTLSKDYARFRDFFPTDLVPILKWVWGGGGQ